MSYYDDDTPSVLSRAERERLAYLMGLLSLTPEQWREVEGLKRRALYGAPPTDIQGDRARDQRATDDDEQRAAWLGRPAAEREQIREHGPAWEDDLLADQAKDQRATGPSPEEERRARGLDEEQGIYRSLS